jgi:hypothetical protein
MASNELLQSRVRAAGPVSAALDYVRLVGLPNPASLDYNLDRSSLVRFALYCTILSSAGNFRAFITFESSFKLREFWARHPYPLGYGLPHRTMDRPPWLA